MKKDFTLFDVKMASYLIVVVDWTCVRNEMKRVDIFIEFFLSEPNNAFILLPDQKCISD